MIDQGIGTASEIQKILAAFQPGEMVTARVIAKRCGLTRQRTARTLECIYEGTLARKLDPTNRQRWMYGLPEVVA